MPPGRWVTCPSPNSATTRVADPLDQVAVVADDDERARPAVEQVLEPGQRVDVEVVGGLVEQQDVRLGHQQPGQLQPAPLAAGELADRRPLPGRGEARAARAADDAVSSACRAARTSRPARSASSTRMSVGRSTSSWRSSASCTVLPLTTRPPCGGRSPASVRSSVVLPEPLTPTRPTRSPGPSRQVTSVEQRAARRWSAVASSSSSTVRPSRLVANPSSSTRVAGRRDVGDQRLGRLDPVARLRRARRRARGAARPAPCGPGCCRRASAASACRARSARAKIQSA